MWPFMMGWGMWFWFLILAGLGYLFWVSYRPRRMRYVTEDALEIVQMRLARGEITLEEFKKIEEAILNS